MNMHIPLDDFIYQNYQEIILFNYLSEFNSFIANFSLKSCQQYIFLIKNIRQHVSFCFADKLMTLYSYYYYYYLLFESEGVSILSYDFDRL